ncbi:NRDE family protein [Polaromonas sp. YR568]|uniref:NRDE family protein n=1 Tax=Polaromonas sp. YR568 TaxID=1855301 RepID=UPI00398BCC51
MCLVAFAIGASTRRPLVIAANRDEFLERPTLPLARWKTASGQEILSGRDLRAGGTWLGITPGGRVAFLTNVRQATSEAAPRSRGELVTRWLTSDADAAGFVAGLEENGAAFGGFNLVLGDLRQKAWTWVTNKYAGAPVLHAQALAPGLYGLSNAGLDTPWPKTVELKRVLSAALQSGDGAAGDESLQALLWTALGNRQRALPADLPHTGVPADLEEALSSAFVEVPGRAYGTRCSTVLLATASGRDWDIRLEERTHGRGAIAGAAGPIHREQLSFRAP